MKRPALLAVLLFVCLAPKLEAEAIECVPSKACEKDEKPPACCRPPPSQFWSALKLRKSKERAFNLSLKDFEKDFWRFVVRRGPGLTVSEACAIGTGHDEKFKEQSLEDALAVAPHECREVVEADFAEARQQQLSCLSLQKEKKPPTKEEKWHFQRMANQAAIESLEEKLFKWFKACSSPTGAEKAQGVAKKGLEALKKAPAKKPVKKHAKRSSGTARK
jgi:hypothetical protein